MIDHFLEDRVAKTVDTLAEVAAEQTARGARTHGVRALAEGHMNSVWIPLAERGLALLARHLLGNDRCWPAGVVLKRGPVLANMGRFSRVVVR